MKSFSSAILAKLILDYRKDNKVSQEALATESGINRSILSKIEQGEHIPSVTQLETLANIIGFDTEADAHDFYDFWMSKYGVQLTKLWKNGTNVYGKFIPYFWAKPGQEKKMIMQHFNLTDEEYQTLMNM